MQENDFLEIDESTPEYELRKLTPGSEAMLNLYHKHVTKYITRAKFWKERLNIGKRCMNALRREIFTPGQRAKYRVLEKKWPIELQLMKRVINTLSDKIESAVPGSEITYEDDSPPQYAAKPETVKTVLTWMKQQLRISDKRKKVLRTGLTTGYPICLWFEKVRGISSAPGLIPLIPSVLDWDSVLPEPFFDENKGIRDVTFIQKMTTAQLYKTFPDRVDAHKKHLEKLQSDPFYRKRLELSDNTKTADDRRTMVFNMIGEAVFNSSGGHYMVMQNVFPISQKIRAWFNPETYDVFVPPPDWSIEQREMWLNEHQEFNMSDEVTLDTSWITVIDSSGFVWENNESWYQEEGELPCAWFIADMVDGIPCGAGEDRLPYVLLASACATEGLDQVRRGTGRLTAIAEGAIKNRESLRNELSRSEGVAITKKGIPVREAITQFVRSPNATFLDMQDRIENQLDAIDGVEFLMGSTNPRQSEDAKRLQISQGLSQHSPYLDSYSTFDLSLENLLCKLIPRAITEEMVIQLKDEYGQKQEPVTVNGTEFDYSGEARRIVNDIISPRYRAVATIANDSSTSRESQMKDFMQLLEAVGNQLFKLDPIFLGKTLGIFPNIFAREASKFLIEFGERQQQQMSQAAQLESQAEIEKQRRLERIDMEKIKRPKIAFKISPQDLVEAPDGAKVMYQMMKDYEATAEAERAEEKQENQMQQQQIQGQEQEPEGVQRQELPLEMVQ